MKRLYQEDISELCLEIHDWLQRTPLAATEEGFDWLCSIIENKLEPFSHGYQNYN
jgi:hypothetical protein